jgi:dipeptidyl aminopeptidase/acylaminoacyl peptidase
VIPVALAATALACPRIAGAVTYVRAGKEHVVSLASCTDRVLHGVRPSAGGSSAVRSPNGHRAWIRARPSEQSIVVDGRVVLRVHEDRSRVPGGIPGPLGLVTFSPDGRYLFYFVDPQGSASIPADGLVLRVLDVSTGRARRVVLILPAHDYWSWCGSTLVLTAGGNRLATTNKRLETARAPDWRPRPLWADPPRAFGSVSCAPDGQSVAVLSQREQHTNWSFFATRWQLWRVRVDGSRTLLDRAPAGDADESPVWSPDGRSLLFVRERKGYGRIMLLHDRRLYGPLANLGYSLGFYGHHAWPIAWRR